jgi:DNA-binding MarR family transcriptional regulator
MTIEFILVNKVSIRYHIGMKTKQIYDYIERLSNLLRNDMRREGAEHGLQPVQLEALNYLSICNRYSDTPMGVTEYLGQTKGTVSQSLKVLEKKAFLTKHADKNDRRITHLKVSSTGEQLLKKSIPAPLFTHACEHLNEQSETQIVTGLKELLQAVQRSNGMKSFGVCHTCRYNQKNEDRSFFCDLTKESLSQSDVQLICREHKSVA